MPSLELKTMIVHDARFFAIDGPDGLDGPDGRRRETQHNRARCKGCPACGNMVYHAFYREPFLSRPSRLSGPTSPSIAAALPQLR